MLSLWAVSLNFASAMLRMLSISSENFISHAINEWWSKRKLIYNFLIAS